MKNARNIVPLAAILITSVFAHADADAVITGPKTSKAGNLVVLNSTASSADVTQWIFPASLEGRYVQVNDLVFFSVRESATFTFHLIAIEIVSENEAQIDVTTHTVTITDGFGEVVTPPPVDPDDPPPVTDNALVKLSRDAARQLNDPTTANALAEVLATLPMGTLQQMSNAARANVEAVLLNRTGQSRSKDWLNVWRKSINSAVNTSTPETYKASLSAIAQGLREA